MKIETVQCYQILVLRGFACVARTKNVLFKHRMPVIPRHVNAAVMRNAKQQYVYQEPAKVIVFMNLLRQIWKLNANLSKIYIDWQRYFLHFKSWQHYQQHLKAQLAKQRIKAPLAKERIKAPLAKQLMILLVGQLKNSITHDSYTINFSYSVYLFLHH